MYIIWNRVAPFVATLLPILLIAAAAAVDVPPIVHTLEVEGQPLSGIVADPRLIGLLTEVIEYQEAGEANVAKRAGLTNVGLFTVLCIDDCRLINRWYQNIVGGQVDRRDLTLVIYDRDPQHAHVRWNLRECWPSGLAGRLSGDKTLFWPEFTMVCEQADTAYEQVLSYYYTVTTLADHDDGQCSESDCSLREAINAANAAAGPNNVNFAPGLSGVIVLNSLLPAITEALTIDGPGADVLAVSGAGLYRIFTVDAGPVSISGLTLRDGYARNLGWPDSPGLHGGAVYAVGSLKLSGVVIRDCRADSHGGGIHIYNGLLEISSSSIYGNVASWNGGGFSMYSDGQRPATVVIADSDIYSNTAGNGAGGGFYALSERVIVDLQPGVALHRNRAAGSGGGAYMESQSWNLGDVQLTAAGTAIHDNESGNGGNGGGLSIVASKTVTATLSGLNVFNNQAAAHGGGLSITRMACEGDASVELSNTEIYSNVAAAAGSGYGGGLHIASCGAATLSVTDSEIHHNTVRWDGSGLSSSYGGGVAILGEGSAVFSATHIDANTAAVAGGGVYANNSAVVAIGGSVSANTSGGNGGGVTLAQASAFFTATLFQENSAAWNGGAFQIDGTARAAVVDGCIVGNSDTAVVNNGSQAMIATNNWWGVRNGPAGVGPGLGDSISANVDFANYKTSPPPGCLDRSPIIAVGKTVAGVPAPGDTVTYTVVITNAGRGPDINVHLGDVLPVQLNFLDWLQRPAGADIVDDLLTWRGAVAASERLTFTLRSTYVGGYSEVVTNTAVFSGSLDTGYAAAAFAARHSLSVAKDGSGAGTISSLPAGIDCGATCAAAIAPGTFLTLTATPSGAATFTGWSGACTGDGANPVCALNMDSSKAVTATFRLVHDLTVRKAGAGSGEFQFAPPIPPLICASGCNDLSHTYEHGQVVNVSMRAHEGSAPGGLSGDCAGYDSCAVTIDSDKLVTATFLAADLVIVFKTGDGDGAVVSDPPGVNCGTLCQGYFAAGRAMTLTANANINSTFGGWAGACVAVNPSSVCTLQIQGATATTATFTLDRHPLRLTKTGSGNVHLSPPDVDCDLTCTDLAQGYAHGAVVTLTAQAANGYAFAGWGEACAVFGTNPVCLLTMDAAKDVAAHFVTRAVNLQVYKVGSGRVYGGDPLISCGSTCAQLYQNGAAVTLYAVPEGEQVFAGWSGACTVAAPAPCVLTMDIDQVVTATFGTPGSLAGTLLLSGTNPAVVGITAERLTEAGWQWTADRWLSLSGAAGARYAGMPESTEVASAQFTMTGLPSGLYRVSFRDWEGNYRSEYYNNVSWSAPDLATAVDVSVNNTTQLADVTMDPPHAPVADVTSGSGGVTANPNTGQVIVAQPMGAPADITVRYAAACPGGATPSTVTLQHGSYTFPMAADPLASGYFVHVIPAASRIGGADIGVSYMCNDQPTVVVIGSVQLYDPSGVVTNADSSQPVQDAQVVLFRIPGWRPDVAGETRECRTVDTRNGANWDGEPAADVHLGAALNGTTDANLISPDVNPQRTDAAGRYGWDVAEGCYYVLVTAAGYEAKVSPVVGVPPAVTDLDLRLTPLPGQHSIYLPVLSR